MLEPYYRDHNKRQYTGRIGENFVGFVTWNYAKGIIVNDKDLHNWPGKPDFNAWFGKDVSEILFGIEVKTKKSLEYLVIDDKVLYNIIRCQKLNNEGRKDIILVFLIWDTRKLWYIPLEQLCRGIEINVNCCWTEEVMSDKKKIINPELLLNIDETLGRMCDRVSKLTDRYSSKQVNKVFEIDPSRLKAYPYDFLKEYGFEDKAKLENLDLQLFVQFYLEQRHWLQTKKVNILYENVQRIKKHKDIPNEYQLTFPFAINPF